jgi:hypothetical protein
LQAIQELWIYDVRKFSRVRRPLAIQDAIDIQKNDLHALPPSQPLFWQQRSFTATLILMAQPIPLSGRAWTELQLCR